MNRFIVAVSLLVAGVMACSAQAAIRIVRTGTTYTTVQAAVNAALAGDTIELDSGTYLGTTACATINKNNLVLRGVGTTKPVLNANGTSTGGKAIWVVTASNTTVENIEFTNCHVAALNGAGIKLEGATLTCRHCYFHDNEMGVLTNANTSSDITLEYCEFNYNGYGDGYSHNIYVGHNRTFTMKYCWSRRSYKGQLVKTRAETNYILYNRITCESDGYSNYEIDVPNGGTTYIIGNLIHQGASSTNGTIITYGAEGLTNADQHLYVVNNTIVNNRGASTGINNYGSAANAVVMNNILQNVGTPIYNNNATATTNWITSNAYLANVSTCDYHLTASSTGAINAGTTPGTGINGFNMTPIQQYVHSLSYESRPVVSTIDIGCYEYGSAPALPTVQFSAASSSGAESTTAVSLPVTLSASSSSTVTVNYAVTGGSATGSGTDYTLASGVLTFNPGVTTQNIPVTINNDTMDENDETIIIGLSSPSNATLGTTTSHTYTITDNDNPPTVQFSSASSSGSEATTAVNLTVTLSAASGKAVGVSYSVTGGTATNGTDYTISGTGLSFTAGQTSKTIPVTVTNDTTIESNETIVVGLNSPSNATLGTTTSHTYTINDNDQISVQFASTNSSASEATTPAALTVNLNAAAGSTVTVQYEVTSGTATAGPDFCVVNGTGDIVALKRTAGLTAGGVLDARFTSLAAGDVVLTTVKDARLYNSGGARYYNYGVSTSTGGFVGNYGIYSFDLASYSKAAISKAQMRFKAGNGNTGVSLAGVKSHDWAEGNKDGVVPGASPAAAGVCPAHPNGTYTAASGTPGWGASSNAYLDVAGDGADLYNYITFSSAPAGVAFLVCDVTSLVQDWVAGSKPNYGVLVNPGNHGLYLSEQGTADEPVLFVDYVLQRGTLTFTVGQTSKTIDINIVNDTAIEANETVVVTLSNPSGASLGTNTAHTYTITNND